MLVEDFLKNNHLEVRRVGGAERNFQQIIGDMSLWDSNKKIKDVRPALCELKNISIIKECVIIQKCNSIEFYVVTTDPRMVDEVIYKVWKKFSKKFHEDIYKTKLEKYSQMHGVRHLFETICGVKSVILGDSQVRGQVLKAFQIARESGCTGVFLQTLFEYAKIVDDEINNKTSFHRGYTSIERNIVAHLLKENVHIDSNIAVLGAGSSGQLICKALHENGFKKVFVYTKNPEKAKKIKDLRYVVYSYSYLKQNLKEYDIIIATTDSPKHLITINDTNLLKKDVKIFDISVPPVIDLEIEKIKKIRIYHIDDIRRFADKTIEMRKKELIKVNSIIGRECENFKLYLQKRLIDYTIKEHLSDRSIFIVKKPIFIIKSSAINYMKQFLTSEGFIEIFTPLITVIPVDITTTKKVAQFEVDYYGKKSFLRASAQYYKSLLIVNGFEKIYEIAPFWRKLTHHRKDSLCEAWAVDCELTTNNTDNIINLLKNMIISCREKLWENEYVYLRDFGLYKALYSDKIMKITFSDLVEYFGKNGVQVNDDRSFRKYLPIITKHIINEFDTSLYFVTNLPVDFRRFYVKNIDEKTSTRFYFIMSDWIVASGSLRECDYETLEKNLIKSGLPPKRYKLYLDIYKDKNVPQHGGFALGIERFITKLLGFGDVSRVVAFPRTSKLFVP